MRPTLTSDLTGACLRLRGVCVAVLAVLAGCEGQQSALNPAGVGAQSIANTMK